MTRIAIKPIADPIGLPLVEHDDWEAVPPDGFLPARVMAKQFISQTAKYRVEGQVALLHRGKVYANNNQVFVEFDLRPNDLAGVQLWYGGFFTRDLQGKYILSCFSLPPRHRVSK